MNDLSRLGRILYVLAILALGLQAFVCSAYIYELEPVSSGLQAQVIASNLTGAFLVAVSVGFAIRPLARWAAVALGSMLLAWVLFLHVPVLVHHPASDLSFAFETLALAGIAWAMAGDATAGASGTGPWSRVCDTLARLGRYAFGASLLVFCIVNFMFHGFIAGMIPAWIPAHLFFAYFTGVASAAAGVSILVDVRARLALVLLGAMYGSWVLVIHVPYLAAQPHARGMWTDMFITVALAGGAWFLAGRMPAGRSVRGVLGSLRFRTDATTAQSTADGTPT